MCQCKFIFVSYNMFEAVTERTVKVLNHQLDGCAMLLFNYVIFVHYSNVWFNTCVLFIDVIKNYQIIKLETRLFSFLIII